MQGAEHDIGALGEPFNPAFTGELDEPHAELLHQRQPVQLLPLLGELPPASRKTASLSALAGRVRP
jgi:hypothetical protein